MKFRKKKKYFLKKYKRNMYVRNEYFWKKKSLYNKIYTKSKKSAKFYISFNNNKSLNLNCKHKITLKL